MLKSQYEIRNVFYNTFILIGKFSP